MRAQSFSFLGWMSFGALAAAFGFMSVLHQAKLERISLEARVTSLQQTVAKNDIEKEQLADQANQQVEAANKLANDAKAAVDKIKQDQALLARAVPLTAPTGRAYAAWTEALSLPLGISVRIPPGSTSYTDERGLIASRVNQATSTLPWLSVSTYSEPQERSLASAIENPETVAYLVSGNLLTGVRGKRAGQTSGYTYVLQIISPETGSPSHLVWAQTQGDITDARLRDSFASLSFRS